MNITYLKIPTIGLFFAAFVTSALSQTTIVSPTSIPLIKTVIAVPAVVAQKLAFQKQPANANAGSIIGPAVTVGVLGSNGALLTTGKATVTLTLQQNGAKGALTGTLTNNAALGLAAFSGLRVSAPGQSYRLVATSAGLTSAVSDPFAIVPAATSQFVVPSPNACQSPYDRFYSNEPGVYAFWALCEQGTNPVIHDYVGPYDLAPSGGTWGGTWGTGTITGGFAGPIADGESAMSSSATSAFIESIGLAMNKNQGTISAWINSNAVLISPAFAVMLPADNGKSYIALDVYRDPAASNGTLCLGGQLNNSSGTWFPLKQCGYSPNTWHRVTMTWSTGTLTLYIDGTAKSNLSYVGTLDDQLFNYWLFSGCCGNTQDLRLAKVLVSNQAWDASQAMTDFSPVLTSTIANGVHVTTKTMGTIHRDVLGYGDNNSDISTSQLATPLLNGLRAAGVTSLRYAGGFGGNGADLSNWRGGPSCTGEQSVTTTPQNLSTLNNIDSYLPQLAVPLALHLGYTVNYGTNPPLCNAGGDPIANGANLVDYVNNQKHYGVKYWEIGNEVFSYQSEIDFHNGAHTGASYVLNEPAFYDAMKSRDPSIQIGVPIGEASYDYQTGFDFPVLKSGKFDSIAWHNYPVVDPISDGDILYQDRVASKLYRTRGVLLRLQTELLNVGKSPDSIWITEWNADAKGGAEWSRQSMGAVIPLFTTIQLAEYMQAGVPYATWFTQGMSNACYQYFYDWTGEASYNWWSCGGLSLVYTGALPAETLVGLKPGDLTPAGRAFQILSQSGFVTEGEHMLQAVTDVNNAPWLVSYAATHGNSYAVILINRDRDNSHIVPVVLDGKSSGTNVSQWTFGRAQYDQTYFGNWSVAPLQSSQGAWSGTYNATLPPWSVSVFVF